MHTPFFTVKGYKERAQDGQDPFFCQYVTFINQRLCDMCLYIHTDSPSSVVSASSNRRGIKNEPKMAKTHSSVGMLHLLTKDYVHMLVQMLPPLISTRLC